MTKTQDVAIRLQNPVGSIYECAFVWRVSSDPLHMYTRVRYCLMYIATWSAARGRWNETREQRNVANVSCVRLNVRFVKTKPRNSIVQLTQISKRLNNFLYSSISCRRFQDVFSKFMLLKETLSRCLLRESRNFSFLLCEPVKRLYNLVCAQESDLAQVHKRKCVKGDKYVWTRFMHYAVYRLAPLGTFLFRYIMLIYGSAL